MAEWDEKLGAILNNPQAMGQIMALANSLSETGSAPPPPPSAPAPAPETPPPSPLLNPQLLQLGGALLGEAQKGEDENIALLRALRPFLKEQRYEKLDRAIELARLSRMIRVLFQALGGGEKRV